VWLWAREELEDNPGLEATTLFEWLQQKYPHRFAAGQLRTLQRKIRSWRMSERLERLRRQALVPSQPAHTPIILGTQRPATALPIQPPVVYSANAGPPDENEDLIRKVRILPADFD
jgi:hypothetical protein